MPFHRPSDLTPALIASGRFERDPEPEVVAEVLKVVEPTADTPAEREPKEPDIPEDVIAEWREQADSWIDLGAEYDAITAADDYVDDALSKLAKQSGLGYQPHENDIDLLRLNTGYFQPTEYAVDRLFPRKQVSLVSGHGESFKSMATLQAGICVAAGMPFAGLKTNQGRVLFYSMEDGEDMVGHRLENMLKGLGMTHRDLRGNLIVRDMSDADPPYIAREQSGLIVFEAQGESLLAEISSGCFDMVVIDNASEAYAANESDRPLVRQFMGKLRQAGRAGDCAVVVIAHVNRMSAAGNGGDENYSGSTQWHNSARSRIFMRKDENLKGAGVIKHEKLNTGPKLPTPIQFEFKNGALSFDVKAIASREASDDDKARRALFPDLLKTLLWAEANGKLIRSSTSGPSNVSKCLSEIPGYPSKMKKGQLKKDVPAALNLMEAEKLICQDTRKNENRKEVNFWALTDAGRAVAIRVQEGGDISGVDDSDAPF